MREVHLRQTQMQADFLQAQPAALQLHLPPVYSLPYPAYQKRAPLDEQNSRVKAPANDFHPNQLVQKSEYREEYYRKKNKPEQQERGGPMPNNMSLGGPTFAETTYGQSYTPKHSPPPKQIKNPENLGNSRMRMNATSSYKEAFKWNDRKHKPREQPIIRSNNLKT